MPKVYKRKKHLRERYGDISEKTLDRWRKDGRVPQPDFYRGQVPYWDETRLDAADLKAIKESRTPELSHGLKEHRDRKSKAAKESLRA